MATSASFKIKNKSLSVQMTGYLSLLLCSAVLLLGTAPAWGASFAPTERLELCQPEQFRSEELFSTSRDLRVLVTPYLGLDTESEQLGKQLSLGLKGGIERFLQEQETKEPAGLPDHVQVKYVPCLVTSHSEARRIGQAWGADVVFWGQAKKPVGPPPTLPKNPLVTVNRGKTEVSSSGDIKAGGSVRISADTKVNVTLEILPTVFQPGVFRTAVTVTAWSRLQAEQGQSQRVPSDPKEFQDLGLAQIASGGPIDLWNLVLGIDAARSRRFRAASAWFSAASGNVNIQGSSAEQAQIYGWIGQSHLYADKKQDGLAAFEKALTICSETDVKCRAIALNNKGWALERSGEWSAALVMFKQAEEQYRQTGEPIGRAALLCNMGRVRSALGDPKSASEHYQQALSLSQGTNQTGVIILALLGRGQAYAELRDAAGASTYLQSALSRAKALPAKDTEAATLANLGSLFLLLGEYQQALEQLQAALALWKMLDDTVGQATALTNIGRVYEAQGAPRKALSPLQSAIGLWQRLGHRPGLLAAQRGLASIYTTLGEKELARAAEEQAGLLKQGPPQGTPSASPP